MPTLTDAQIRAIGRAAAEAAVAAVSRPRKARAGAAVATRPVTRKPARTASPKAKKPNTFKRDVIDARVGCAYDAPECADRTFTPHGIGQYSHSSCEQGRAYMVANQRPAPEIVVE